MFEFPRPQIAVNPLDARAMTDAELAEMMREQARRAVQAQLDPNNYSYYLTAMQNYRPPVHVPQGMADWYACGDDLH